MYVNSRSVKSSVELLHRDMALSARLGKLHYVNDDRPGFSRKRQSKSFRYVDADGQPLKDAAHLARIKSLAIPPAWAEVWICPLAEGHLQATGRDAKGRKQYRYHKQWREVRDEVKYGHMIDFGLHLPMIRQKVDEDLERPGLSREKVLAAIIYLLENTMIRVGNEEYARSNKHFGLTTLRNRHVEVNGSDMQFHFRGKSGIERRVRLRDSRLARIIRRVKDLPGQELFQYVDSDGERHSIGSADVNEYLKQITGRDYTAKDFRTWSGTLQTALALKTLERFENEIQAKKNVNTAIEIAAKKLGNTPTICKKCYVHPLIIQRYMDGLMFDLVEVDKGHEVEGKTLDSVEQYILQLLQNKQNAVPSFPA